MRSNWVRWIRNPRKSNPSFQWHDTRLLCGQVQHQLLLEEAPYAVHDACGLLLRAFHTQDEVVRIPEQHAAGLPSLSSSSSLVRCELAPVLVPELVKLVEVDVG